MADSTRAKLIISSKEYAPEEITERVGRKCDEFWKIGDIEEVGREYGKVLKKREMLDNGWVVHSGLGEERSIEEHIESLLTRLAPYASHIKELSESCDVEILCVSWIESGCTFPISVDKAQIKAISDLGAELGFDLYALGGDGE